MERTEDINGRIKARKAIVSARNVQCRRVRGRTPNKYGPTTQIVVRMMNQVPVYPNMIYLLGSR